MREGLEHVARYCERFVAGDGDEVVEAALLEAALVTYGRCFAPARSTQGLPPRTRPTREILAKLSVEQREMHAAAMRLRNRHGGRPLGRDDLLMTVALTLTPGEPPPHALDGTDVEGAARAAMAELGDLARALVTELEAIVRARRATIR